MAATPTSSDLVTLAPNPNNKIQGLVVLLYGRGGFGKSTLLKRYRQMATEQDWRLAVSTIVDWEFAVEGKRGLFKPAPGQPIDASDYFKLLCSQLTYALGKRTDEFREYHKAVEAVQNARREARSTLDNLQKDDRYAWLRKIASEEVVAVLRTVIPGANLVPGIDSIAAGAKEGLDQVIKIGADQANHLYAKLSDRLKEKLDDYLEPALTLGLSLGRDLSNFARNFPLLIFFDTYEEIDEGDSLLRLVMAAAGVRVGWVLAGRDNLWTGLEQRRRSPGMDTRKWSHPIVDWLLTSMSAAWVLLPSATSWNTSPKCLREDQVSLSCYPSQRRKQHESWRRLKEYHWRSRSLQVCTWKHPIWR